MDSLSQILSIAGAVKILLTGVIAGCVAFAGVYWRQRNLTNSQIRTERWIALIGETVYFLVESHNHMHPEAKIDTTRFARLLFSVGVQRTPPQDEG